MAGSGLGDFFPQGNERHKAAPQQIFDNDQGTFAAPSDLFRTMTAPILDEYPAAGQTRSNDFVFEENLLWNASIADMPVFQQRKSPVRSAAATNNTRRQTRSQTGNRQPKDGHKNWHSYLYVAIITVCFLCMSVIAVMMMPQMAGYFWTDFDNFAFINGELLRYDPESAALYKQYRSYMTRDVIYPGVFINGVNVGDMTVEQAREALGSVPAKAVNPYSVTVSIGDKRWTVDGNNVPAIQNLGNVLERAYAIGRTNTTDIQITHQTPFRQRTDYVIGLRENGINLTTEVTYDTAAVRAVVDEIAAFVNREPIDAQILSFDYKTRTFTFTEDQPGIQIDSEGLYQRIIHELDQGSQGAVVTADLTLTPATITKESLASNFTMIAAYTTDTTSESNRNTNINLACQAINGTAIMPGEVFSFNKTTGQRTTDKGYRSAGAIAAGQSIEEVGGGICQVSSTIFNAAARADLEIVERSPHAWPSTYVDRGEDATVNWPNLDFKFKNNTSAPIFLITYYSDRKMSAEIWGLSLGNGVSIDLESKVVRTIEPPMEINYVNNPELPFGTSQTTVKARTGYVVETYKVWYQNGQETKRELFYTTTYKAYQQVVEFN
ncbi:MAG: hypothetical protein E7319_03320 [Clostridiales bacterium]|nr:hypothetical protein [Clostridiales bacterium]